MTRLDDQEVWQYGFRWGQVDVTRAVELNDKRRVVQVTTDHKSLDIYVSTTGRSVRVFSAGVEWKPVA